MAHYYIQNTLASLSGYFVLDTLDFTTELISYNELLLLLRSKEDSFINFKDNTFESNIMRDVELPNNGYIKYNNKDSWLICYVGNKYLLHIENFMGMYYACVNNKIYCPLFATNGTEHVFNLDDMGIYFDKDLNALSIRVRYEDKHFDFYLNVSTNHYWIVSEYCEDKGLCTYHNLLNYKYFKDYSIITRGCNYFADSSQIAIKGYKRGIFTSDDILIHLSRLKRLMKHATSREVDYIKSYLSWVKANIKELREEDIVDFTRYLFLYGGR